MILSILLPLLPLAVARTSHPRRTDTVHLETRTLDLEPRALGSYAGTLPTHPQFVYNIAQTGLPPDPTTLQGWNMYAMCFWNTDGVHFNAQTWASLPASKQKSILSNYHKHNKKLLISAFGDAEQPTSQRRDAVSTAKSLAAWVKRNNVDGVDIDYEDFDACWNQTCAKWLISFQTALRQQLGTKYIITHAPIAPWFATSNQFAGGYLAVHKAVGGSIDLYSVQFYNQGKAYTTCDSLIVGGGSAESVYTGTALMEIVANGVPKNKLLLGKPASTKDAGSGYMPLDQLHQCVQLARSKGWNTGLMVWAWGNAKPEQFFKKVWG